jgi:hypothetical protein
MFDVVLAGFGRLYDTGQVTLHFGLEGVFLGGQEDGELFLDVIFVEYFVQQVKETFGGFHGFGSVDIEVHAGESDFLDVKICFSEKGKVFFDAVVFDVTNVQFEQLFLHDQSAFAQLNQEFGELMSLLDFSANIVVLKVVGLQTPVEILLPVRNPQTPHVENVRPQLLAQRQQDYLLLYLQLLKYLHEQVHQLLQRQHARVYVYALNALRVYL